MKRLLLILRTVPLLLLLGSLPVCADYPIEVIQLNSRSLEEILPVIKPFVGADGSATGMGSSLVLKAAPARVLEIRKLLLEIDRPPKRLLIRVSKHSDLESSVSGYSASADIKAGDGQVSINSPGHRGDGSRARIRVYDTDDQRRRTIGHMVQALEGRPAFIASGSLIPVRTIERYYGYGHPHARYLTQMQDVSSGFYVVPRLHGDQVTLEIQQRDDRPGMYRGEIRTQSADTVVRGRLGEWFSLGGIDTSRNNREGGLGRSISTQESIDQQIKVMVECMDCGERDGRYQEPIPGLHGFDRLPPPANR